MMKTTSLMTRRRRNADRERSLVMMMKMRRKWLKR
jgi:hypothetical protein